MTSHRAQYVAGNTGGELVWRAQALEDAEVIVVGDSAVLTAVAHDVYRARRRGGSAPDAAHADIRP